MGEEHEEEVKLEEYGSFLDLLTARGYSIGPISPAPIRDPAGLEVGTVVNAGGVLRLTTRDLSVIEALGIVRRTLR